jgi:addiction module HigA family antidote
MTLYFLVYQSWNRLRSKTMKMYNPPHPGLLIEDIMGDRTITALAKHLGVTRAALSRVINGKAAVSAEMALRLQDAFGVNADLWLSMQTKRDLWVASQKKRVKVARFVFDKAA